MSTSAAFSHESGPRLNAGLLEVFAGLALLIAAIGIYGVLWYVVNQRRQEIGVRMALGAGRGHVLALVLREGMGMALFGIAAGLAVAFAVSRLLAALLFGMQARDAKQPRWPGSAFIQYSVTMLPITPKPAWKNLLATHAPVQLPAAHDALTAKLIEAAGFNAYQIGGFALAGARHGIPDVDLVRFAEQVAGVRDIIAACRLPVLVDADDGYGDVKNVTHTVRSYESMGVSAIFLEDQVSPKRCGHMAGKQVVPVEIMEQKIRAAVAARRSADFFLIARTDALEPCGLDEALKRADRYFKAGADGLYVEAPKSRKHLEKIGRTFAGVPQATNMFEGDNETPWLTPRELHELGFSMILYPTTLLFRVVRAIEKGLQNLKDGKPSSKSERVDLQRFEEIVEMPAWSAIEDTFQKERPKSGA